MKTLTHRDLQYLLAALSALHTGHDMESLPSRIFAATKQVISAESFGLFSWDMSVFRNEHATEFPINRSWVEPQVMITPADLEIYSSYLHEDPVREMFKRTSLTVPQRVSDIIPDSRYYRLGIYNEYFRRVGLDRMMVVGLSVSPDAALSFVLNRHKTDFSERDRSLLAELRPHLINAYRSAEAFSELQQEQARLQTTLEQLEQGLIFLTSDGSVKLITERAHQLLTKYFAPLRGDTNHLPEELARWLAHHGATREMAAESPVTALEVVRADARLHVRLLINSTTGQNMLLLEEKRTTLSFKALESLGLTKREAEVLSWVVEGKTNHVIAMLCDMKPRTVEKHLEHIYEKLGVETRTAATRHVIEALQGMAL